MSCSYCIIGTRLNIHHFEGSMTLTEGHQCYEAAKICFHVHMLIVRSLRGIASTFFFSESLKVFPSQTNKWKQFLSHLFSCDQAALWMVQSAKKSNIPWIWRIIYGHKLPYMKKTKITLYEEDKKEEASMRCSLLHGSWDQILRRRPSVCLFVTPFWLRSHYRIITKFSGVITYDRSDVHAKGQGHKNRRISPKLAVSGL